jgi:uncharacterized protein YecT (DUF1311 family)
MRKIILMIGIVVGACCAVSSQVVDPRNAIDTTMNKCLETRKANMLRVECYNNASEAWEKDVNDKYAAVQKLLPEAFVPAFKDSQSTWGKYRDTQWRFLDIKNAKQRGTGHIAGRIIERMAVVRERALFLDDLYSTYKESN